MRHLLFTAAALLLGCNASLAQVSTMGTTAMGLSSTPGTMLVLSAQRPEPVLGDHPAGHARYDTGAGAAGIRSVDAGNGRDLCHASGANRLANADGAGYFDVGNGKRDRDDATDLGRAHGTVRCSRVHGGRLDRAISAVGTARVVVSVHDSRLECTGAAAARNSSAAGADCRTVRAAGIDRTDLHSHGGQHSHDDAVDHDHVIDRDDVGDPARNHSHARRRQHDRHHFPGVAARQCFDHRVQLDAGWPTDQRRGFAAVDAASSGKPAARHDRTRGRRSRRHQHRSQHGAESGHGRDADAEHVGLRRERDDESGDARHDDAGQCHRRRCDAGRLGACNAVGMLTATLVFPAHIRKPGRPHWRRPTLKPYLMVRPDGRGYLDDRAAPPRLPPEAVVERPQSGRRTPRLEPPEQGVAALSGSLTEAFAGR